MKPYYSEDGITLYHADCVDVLQDITAESCITDPIWPNSARVFPGVKPKQLLQAALLMMNHQVTKRIVIHLGIDSDPRFLCAVPQEWPFIRMMDLDYARPTYKGKLVQGGDIAYAFGELPKLLGRKLLPGRYISTSSDGLFRRSTWIAKDKHFTRRKDIAAAHDAEALPHPCARRLQHVRWLVKWYGGESVVDPFAGSGTTLLAAKLLNLDLGGRELGLLRVTVDVEAFLFERHAQPCRNLRRRRSH